MSTTNTMTQTGETPTHLLYQTQIDGETVKLTKDKTTGELLFSPESVALALGYADEAAMLADPHAVAAIEELAEEEGGRSIYQFPVTPKAATNGPTFHFANYKFAPAFGGCHVRTSGDTHPMLCEQVLLHEPLRTGPSKLAAHAKTPYRSCAWWEELTPSQLPHTSYAFSKQGDDTYLLVVAQSKKELDQPFRLVVCLVDEHFPKHNQLWGVVSDYLNSLSKSKQPVKSTHPNH